MKKESKANLAPARKYTVLTDIISPSPADSRIVYKHNYLIRLYRDKQLTLLHFRLINSIIARINPMQPWDGPIPIIKVHMTGEDCCDAGLCSTPNLAAMQKIMQLAVDLSLSRTVMATPTSDTSLSITCGADYRQDPLTGQWHIEIFVSPLAYSYLFFDVGAERYARFAESCQRHLRSPYHMAMMELIMMQCYATQEWVWSLADLRRWLGVEDVAYWADFKRLNEKILLPAQKALAQNLGLVYDMKPLRNDSSRKVSHLRIKMLQGISP